MTLLFIHVTKTAGGTIKRMFRESGLDVQFHYPRDEGFDRNFHYDPKKVAVYGHYRFGVHKQMGVNPSYACFVRKPVNRVVSHFHHLRNVDRSRVGDAMRKFDTLENMLEETTNPAFDNLQTRMISGVGHTVGFGMLGTDVLDMAVANLETSFRFVGVFEDLENSIDRLRKIFPSLTPEPFHVNKGKYSHQNSPEALARIREMNHLDRQLYRVAVELSGGS